MSIRTITSPGVEIFEYDNSQYAQTPVGTSVLVMGFSNKGPTDEVLQITSMDEFEQVYGKPTNPAERYFYHSASQLYSSNANVYTARLPYGSKSGDGFGNKYGALVYPILSAFNLSANDEYQKAEITPSYIDSISNDYSLLNTIDDSQYDAILLSQLSKEDKDKFKKQYEENYFVPNTVLLSSASDLSAISSLDELSSKSLNEIAIKELSGNATEELSTADFILFGAPKHIDLTKEQYQKFADSGIDWSNNISALDKELTTAGIVILNSSQTTINNQFEGYYIGVADNFNMEPGSDFDAVQSVQSVDKDFALSTISASADYLELPKARINFSLSSKANSNENSVSEVMENIPSYSLWGNDYIDCTTLGLFKVRRSVYSPDTIKLDYSLQEAYYGSFDYHRTEQSPNGGPELKMFLGHKIDNNSNDLKIFVNKYITNQDTETFLDLNGQPKKKIRFANEAKALFPIGSFTSTVITDKKIGSLPDKIDRIFSKIEDPELFDLDLTIEAGLGTIWTYAKAKAGAYEENAPENIEVGAFDDTFDMTKYIANGDKVSEAKDSFYNTGLTELKGSAGDIKSDYAEIGNKFITFAQKTRKDHMAILDPLRFTCVKGKDLKILQAIDDNGETYNFSQHYYWPMRYQFMFANTSYAAVYNNWGKVYDGTFGGNIWIPTSGTMASIIAYSSTISYPWYAPAGFNRAVVTTLSDIAVYANQKQRDQLYKIAINPIAFFPNDGICVYGQKTLQSKASAFDRINVRRLFLYLEKTVARTMKYFVFEPNTYTTRTQVFNTLNPVFNQVKQQDGMYDYRIICNSNNNTNEIIDNNELVVDIYIAPTKASEYILCNFYAERTGSPIFTENA